jgi:pSer/pThr/pTyr-binding forkhead associated (FHA) protein
MKKQSLEAFLDACGGRGPLCLDVTPPDGHGPVRQVLHQPFALLGRHDRADVCLQDDDVSRRHALVQLIAGRFFCFDLGSRTGTHWDGSAHGCGWLAGLAPFRVGPYRLWLAGDGPDRTPPPQHWDPLAQGSPAGPLLPSVTLDIANDGKTVCRWRLNRALALVGHDPGCKVRLRGPGVSKFHCALVSTPAGVWTVDLLRRHGVHVNGTPVSHSLLEDGDQLQVGNFTIRFGYESSTARPQPVEAASLPGAVVPANGAPMWPTSASLAAPFAAAGAASAELLPALLRHFSQMQQQMFDQSLLFMYQMFQSMHGEQVGALRGELARLDELNRELQTLLVERLKTQPAAPTQPAPPAAKADGPASGTAAPAARPEVAAPKPFTAVPPAAPPGQEKATPAPPPTVAAGDDVHVWLCQRMDAIQQERQGLWERIVGALRKKE